MSDIQVQSLDELDSAFVSQEQSRLTALIATKYPTLDLQNGVLHDIVAFLAGGVVQGVLQKELQRLYEQRSLLAVAQNPDAATTDVLDHMLSNFHLQRQTASAATGTVTVTINRLATTVIPANTIWTVGDVRFTTPFAIVARTDNSLAFASANDQPITPAGLGSWQFVVPVVAADAGIGGNVAAGRPAVPDVAPPNFVRASTNDDFAGGRAEESVLDLLTRARNAIPSSAASGGENLKRVLRDAASLPDIPLSVIGFGHPAQLRDRNSAVPVATGNRVDVYAITQPQLLTAESVKTAKLSRIIDVSTSQWSCLISANDFPAFYDVVSVRKVENRQETGILVDSIERSADTTVAYNRPRIQTAAHGYLSAYATAKITFTDTTKATSALTVGDEANYAVSLRGLPNIAALQSVAMDPQHRLWGADTLIRAAVPAYVFVTLEVFSNGAAVSDSVSLAIREAVVGHINTLGFSGKIFAANISNLVVPLLPTEFKLRRVRLAADIYGLDGQRLPIASDSELTVPNLPSVLITPETVGFFSWLENVEIAV